MIAQTSIYKAVVYLVRETFPKPVVIYQDEVLDAFTKPCFFIKFTRTTQSASTNFCKQHLIVTLTYFSKRGTEPEYFDVFDKLVKAFGLGFWVGDRFLKVKDIKDDRIGEQQDVLQVRVTIDYYDKLDKTHSADVIEDIDVTLHQGKEIYK